MASSVSVRRGGNRWHLGEVVAMAQVDEDDARLAEHRWTLTGDGYAARSTVVDGRKRTVFMHREILGLSHGDLRQGDHINGDRLDNRRENLRIADSLINGQNKRPFRNSSSRYRGVYWRADLGKWGAYVTPRGKRIHLGFYVSERDAAVVAEQARRVHMPEAC